LYLISYRNEYWSVTTTTYEIYMVSITYNWYDGIINSDTPIEANVQLCNCTVNTVYKCSCVNRSYTSLGTNTVNGTLTFQNNASLIQINDVANIGNITYIRETTPIKDLIILTVISVLSQKLIDVSPNTDPGGTIHLILLRIIIFWKSQNQMKGEVTSLELRAQQCLLPLGSFIASFVAFLITDRYQLVLLA
jgi:hypothetical protein